MRMFRLIPAMLVCFLIGGEITLYTGDALAYCCGCKCMAGCTCPGRFDYGTNRYCYYCRSADHDNLQASTYGTVQQVRPILQLATERMCLRDRVALRFLAQSNGPLEFEARSFDATNGGDQLLTFVQD
jgi:hypothetical protein